MSYWIALLKWNSVFALRLSSTQKKSKHFSGVTNTIQNDIISITDSVIFDVIQNIDIQVE